jgi:hypothetical protein
MLPFGINKLPHFQAEDPLEGKKAGETSPRKSTPRTLQEVGQQYPSPSLEQPVGEKMLWRTPRLRDSSLGDDVPRKTA